MRKGKTRRQQQQRVQRKERARQEPTGRESEDECAMLRRNKLRNEMLKIAE